MSNNNGDLMERITTIKREKAGGFISKYLKEKTINAR
jgi:hypothetical protein